MASDIQLPKAVEGSKRILKIDLPSKASNHNLFVPKDGSSSDATSCISSLDMTAKESEIDQESLMAESSYMYYPVNGLYGYYYPEYDAQSYFVDNGAFEVQQSASQTDNGSIAYYFPGFQPEYNSYNSFHPGAMINIDGLYSGQQIYYPNSIFSQQFISPGIFPQSVAYGSDLVPAYSWDPSSLVTGGLYGNVHSPAPSKTSFSSRSAKSEKKPSPGLDLLSNTGTHNRPIKSMNKVASVISKGFLPINNLPSYHTVRKDDYNLPDFRTKYDHALFFIIKSYSEDDVHKSIKYNVWASTPNGNKRLDNAFQLAQERKAEKGSECPVFLFFSQNTVDKGQARNPDVIKSIVSAAFSRLN